MEKRVHTMPKYAYRGYVETLSNRIDSALSTIETEHNLEYGTEFEIAMCEALRSALADTYGITRGYVVTEAGESAGDDIVIYQRARFPTLALRRRDDFARKEFVPIEAAYCYIEAKHTLHLDSKDRQSLAFACSQVQRVKRLCASRDSVSPTQLMPYCNIGGSIRVDTPKDFPPTLNPPFGVVFARQVREKKGGEVLADPQQIDEILATLSINTPHGPDLIVVGKNNLVLPVMPQEKGSHFAVRSPFFIPGRSTYHTATVENVAFGIGFLSIMAALDWMQLGVLPWHRIVVNALHIPYD